MMKRLHFMPLMAVVGAMCMFTACDSDDDYVQMPGDGLEAKTYTESDGLAVTLNGDVAYGQTVTFTPGQNGNATLTIKGAGLNINEIIGGVMPNDNAPAGATIPTASMIPGSAQVDIPVQLALDNEGVNTFSGTTSTDYCTFAYAGKVTPESLTVNVTDLKLKNTSMVGSFKAAKDIFVDNGWGPSLDNYAIIRCDWQSEKLLSLFGEGEGTTPPSSLVHLALMFTTAPDANGEDMPVTVLLNQILKEVVFGEDGSVTARYANTGVAGWPETVSPKGLASYVVKDDNTILLFLNPDAIIANTVANASKASRDLDVNALVEGLTTTVVPMLTAGVPVHHGPVLLDQDGNYSDDPNKVSFYLGTETLLPILKIAAPILGDDDVVDAIVDAASKDPNMGMMAAMLPGILKQMPDVIATTTKIELGINLDK